jgi:hypothetical protein
MQEFGTVILAFGAFSGLLFFAIRELIKGYVRLDIEKFKADLYVESERHKKTFEILQVKRAEVVAKIYELIADAEKRIVSLTKPLQEAGEEELTVKEKKAADAYNRLLDHFNRNRIYFDNNIVSGIESLLDKIRVNFIEYRDIQASLRMGIPGPNQYGKVWDSIKNDVPKLREDIRKKFQTLIGIDTLK